jgi:hypothetical protein
VRSVSLVFALPKVVRLRRFVQFRALEEAGVTLRTKPARPPSGRGVRADLQRAFDEFMTRQA